MVDKIDYIFYINLNRRKDRKEEIEKELIKMDLMNKTERFEAIEKDIGYLGCFLSHLECLKKARERGYKNILIFEDDFEFIVDKNYFYNKMNILMNEEWDALFLSYNSDSFIKIDENKIKFNDVRTASGYIIRNHYYNKLIDLYEISYKKLVETGQNWIYVNDQCWRDLVKTDIWYGINDRIGRQRAGFSDLANGYRDYKC